MCKLCGSELFPEYGFESLQDAFECAGYSGQTTWSDDSNPEIITILGLMGYQVLRFLGRSTIRKMWDCPTQPSCLPQYDSSGTGWIKKGLYEFHIRTKQESRMIGSFNTEGIPGTVISKISKAIISFYARADNIKPTDDIKICKADPIAVSNEERWEGVGDVIGTVAAPIAKSPDSANRRELVINTKLINVEENWWDDILRGYKLTLPIAFRLKGNNWEELRTVQLTGQMPSWDFEWRMELTVYGHSNHEILEVSMW